jgi:trigger factor
VPVTQQEQTKPCELSLEIEVEQAAVAKAFSDAYKEIGEHTNVPGFRKGKAPRAILEKYVSEERVIEHAANKLVPPAYEKAIEEAGVQPFGDAEYEVIHLADREPFKFRATVPLPPSVELGEYVGLKVDRVTSSVGEEDVDREIERILTRMAKNEPVERPVQSGDLLVVHLAEPGGEAKETFIEVGKNLPSFDEGLVGMNKAETKTIDLVYPDDYEDKNLAGGSSHVTVTVGDIRERQIPEMNDELVKQISEGSDDKLETVEDLRKYIRTAMEKAASDLADRQVESKLIETIIEGSTICFPESMRDHEVAHRLQDLIQDLDQKKFTLEDYLVATDKTFEEVRASVEASAIRDIEANLVVDEIAKKQNIEVSDGEIDAEIEKMAREAGHPVESVRAYLDRTDGKHAVEHRVERNKVLDFLVHASNIKNVGQKSAS